MRFPSCQELKSLSSAGCTRGQRTELQWGEVLVSGGVGSTLNCVQEGFLCPEEASASLMTASVLHYVGP